MPDFAQLYRRVPDHVAEPGSEALRPTATAPRAVGEPRDDGERPRARPAAGLALSGGGFRAMLFHLGGLRRLYEIDALRHVERISSVSGGSITAARLALHWDAIHAPGADTTTFTRLVQEPLIEFASSKLDVTAVLTGLAIPRTSIAARLADAYGEFLGRARLGDLPARPRFVFCATNLGSGSLVRFARPYTADWQIGKRDELDLPLGVVVAASAAFPPVLSPMVIDLGDDQALTQEFASEDGGEPPPLAGVAPFTHRLELTDGGVYDNLGLQPIEQFATLLVSDGGGPFSYDPSVPRNWLGHMIRCWNVTDRQVRALRRSGLVADYREHRRHGAYWGIQTDYSDYPGAVLPVHAGWAHALAAVPTRLWPMDPSTRKRLVNWSYCLSDAAIRTHLAADLPPPPGLPYPERALDQPPPRVEPSLLRRTATSL